MHDTYDAPQPPVTPLPDLVLPSSTSDKQIMLPETQPEAEFKMQITLIASFVVLVAILGCPLMVGAIMVAFRKINSQTTKIDAESDEVPRGSPPIIVSDNLE